MLIKKFSSFEIILNLVVIFLFIYGLLINICGNFSFFSCISCIGIIYCLRIALLSLKKSLNSISEK